MQTQTQTLISPTDTLFTFREACLYLRVSRATLYRLLTDGILKGHKVGTQWRFYKYQLQACVRLPETTEQG